MFFWKVADSYVLKRWLSNDKNCNRKKGIVNVNWREILENRDLRFADLFPSMFVLTSWLLTAFLMAYKGPSSVTQGWSGGREKNKSQLGHRPHRSWPRFAHRSLTLNFTPPDWPSVTWSPRMIKEIRETWKSPVPTVVSLATGSLATFHLFGNFLIFEQLDAFLYNS